MTREEIIATIKECAQRLGRTPRMPQVKEMRVSKRAIVTHFATYGEALKACGLEAKGSGHKADARALFLSWASITRELGKAPTLAQFESRAEYSTRPLLDRYRSWKNIPMGMMELAKKEGLEGEWKDVLDIIGEYLEQNAGRAQMSGSLLNPKMMDGPIYGEAVQHPAISHAPTNESGVVFLFGVLAQQLGFKVQRVQTEFPDCEAMRQIEPGKWQRARIEFELESKNFLKHGHNAKKCDVIVCWRHNWPDCPLEVVELRQVVKPQ